MPGREQVLQTKAGGRSLPLLLYPDLIRDLAMADNVERDVGQAVKAERMCAGWREIDHAAFHERPTVVDAYNDGAAVRIVGDPHHGAER